MVATSASYALNSTTSSYALNATSASYAQTSSFASTFNISGDLSGSNALFTGTITAQKLVVQTVSSSVIYSSGSNIFGNDLSNTQVFTGSVSVTGSLSVNNSSVILTNQTSSMSVLSASYANNATSASYALNATTSSYALVATSASYALNATTASYALDATSASYANNATSASYALNATSASYALSASSALNATSASYALTSTSASYALNSTSASFATNGGVTQILAGPNITISPLSGKGQVTISSSGTGSGNFNTATGSYGSFYDTTTQINPVANAANSMSFNEIAITNGVSLSGSTSPFNTYIKTENAGVYNIQFSAQIDKTDGGTDSVDIWIRKNGTDLLDTATTVTLNNNNDASVAAWNWFVQSAANDYYQIIWTSADTDMRLLSEVSSSVHPGIPSVILTVNRIDQFLSNTGSFSGDFNGSFTGSLQGTASYADTATTSSYALNSTSASYSLVATSASYALNTTSASYANNSTSASYSNNSTSASYALTSSYSLSGTGFPFSGSAVITGSLLVSGSGITGSLFGTASYADNATSASYALTASFALNGGGGGATSVNFSQPTASATWSFTHNLNTRNPLLQVYNPIYKQIIPNDIVSIDEMIAEIRFDYAQAGYAVASNGGSLTVTGSTSILNQTVSATTWSFNHNLNSKYINFEVYNSSDYVIIPTNIKVVDSNNAELNFDVPATGRVVAQFSGINGAPNATTASYALNAELLDGRDSLTFANTGSNTFSGNQTVTTGYVILSQVSSSLNYADDTAAAAGGVPLGGLYRNGNFILIRLT